MPPMDRDYWTKELREAEAELVAAKRRTELNAAAKRLQRAKAELKALEQKLPTRQGSDVAASEATS
jgi:Skp family chaperone for outer membrane proteins